MSVAAPPDHKRADHIPDIESAEDFYTQMFALAERHMEAAFPDWAPFQVRVSASLLVTTGFDIAPVRRLATDFRMRGVWTELRKGSRNNNGRQFYALRPDLKLDYDKAIAALLTNSVQFYEELPFPISRSESSFLQARWRDRAEEARQIRAELILRGANPSAPTPGLDPRFWDWSAETAEVDPRMQAARRRTDLRLRGFLIALSSQTRFLFGNSLHGIVATIASVLTERKISRSLVRQCDSSQNK